LDTRSDITRINAIFALGDNKLADKSSIPFLMVALHDPEPQGAVSYTAYCILHRLIATLGPPKDHETYLNSLRDEEIKAIEVWWVDELAGKDKGGQ
jgi:hypothetical protein